MSASLKKTHKVSKGESLEAIAKKYGHKTWKTIWNAPDNRALVSKRGEPDSIQPGDILAIPPNEKQVKENEQKLVALNRARDADAKLYAALNNEVGRLEKSIKVYDGLIKGSRETTDQVVGDLEGNLHSMKNWATGVDVAKTLIDIGGSLAKLVSKGYKALSLSGEALKKLNEEAAKEALKIPQDQIKDGTIKGIALLKDKDSMPVAVVGIVADSYDKMTSPSFWANTWVQIFKEHKSWSEAVSMEIGDDIKDRIKSVKDQGAKNVQQLQNEQNTRKGRLADTQKLIRECSARIKATENEASELPQN